MTVLGISPATQASWNTVSNFATDRNAFNLVFRFMFMDTLGNYLYCHIAYTTEGLCGIPV